MTLCFDIGGTRIKYAIIDESYNIKEFDIIATPNNISELKQKVSEILDGFKTENVGFCVAGIMEYSTKTTKHSPNMPFLNDFSFNYFSNKFKIKNIEVENDANAACLNSYRIFKKDNMIHLTLGTGLGGGTIINGKLLRSSISIFEVGHITTNPSGKKCGCKNRGCIEQYTGTNYIEDFSRKYNINKSLEEIFGLYNQDKICTRIVDRFAQNLGIIVADLMNIFGTELFVFSGGLANKFNSYKETLKQTVFRRSFVYRIKPCDFKINDNPDMSGLLGMASVFNEGVYG